MFLRPRAFKKAGFLFATFLPQVGYIFDKVVFICYIARMSKPKEITESELGRWKLLNPLQALLAEEIGRREPSGTEKDPRRTLDSFRYFSSILFIMFNPVIESMRGFCAASEFEKVQSNVCGTRVSLGSFSEAQSVFDPEILRNVLARLAERVDLGLCDPRLAKLPREVAAIDGTLLRALPRMAWALWQNDQNRSAKLHLKFSVTRQAVLDTLVTTARDCERKAMRKMLDSNDFLVGDRYYGMDYSLLEMLNDDGYWFLFRLKENAVYEVVEELPVDEADRKAGVVSDQLIRLGGKWRGKPARLVRIETAEKTFLLVTSVGNAHMSAELIGVAYRSRWEIELFFKWIKCILKNRHLLAESPAGVAIQTYCALIVAMLLFATLKRRPSKRDMEAIRFYFCGIITDKELAGALKISIG